MLTIRDQQIGLLKMIMYLMGIITVIAAVAWNWGLLLLLALILAALPFLTFWEIRNLEHKERSISSSYPDNCERGITIARTDLGTIGGYRDGTQQS
jgi:fatty acid desaturase